MSDQQAKLEVELCGCEETLRAFCINLMVRLFAAEENIKTILNRQTELNTGKVCGVSVTQLVATCPICKHHITEKSVTNQQNLTGPELQKLIDDEWNAGMQRFEQAGEAYIEKKLTKSETEETHYLVSTDPCTYHRATEDGKAMCGKQNVKPIHKSKVAWFAESDKCRKCFDPVFMEQS